jgi:AraC-like DNA-binding protein/mannose-6-phosphate isomerase-like protein (cupin superfamily)
MNFPKPRNRLKQKHSLFDDSSDFARFFETNSRMSKAPNVSAKPTNVVELSWLLDVTESRQPVSESSPIWVREGTVLEGPPTAHPECHPYCEMGIVLEGAGTHLVEGEEAYRVPGDLFLVGPGVPHWGSIQSFPLKFITVYFLPSVLIEMGPESDGVRVLRRFTTKQSLQERLVRPTRELRAEFTATFQQLLAEFGKEGFGREIRLRTLLLDQMVTLLRWEESQGVSIGAGQLEIDWRPILKALHFLRENYTEPVYANDVARAAGMSESRLKVIFNEALGLSWVKYLQGYRIHRAAALLNESGHNVTEAALAVGFESLSHFNETFRSFMGVSPKHYILK